uniref:Si:ch211-153f2.3 n=1 Tax=Gongylonema pulchrum TaxID=637853 RepID=A0A183DLS5_9BILA
LRSAIGKTNLLLDKKLATFDDLVQKHLNQGAHDPQRVLLDDLAGYWALISMQLDQLEEEFREISLLRENNWIQQTSPSGAADTNSAEVKHGRAVCPPVANGERLSPEPHSTQSSATIPTRREKKLVKTRK